MKTLYLVRHAKASRDHPSLADRDRPLTERGLDDATAMGRHLAARQVEPGVIVSSPALRALTTAQLFADQLGHARDDIVIDDRLYAATVDELLAVIHGLDDRIDAAMLFGHNPEFSDVAEQLVRRPVVMPTCAVVQLEFDASSWADVDHHPAVRYTLDKPER